MNEKQFQDIVRLVHARNGGVMWRNNVGVMKDERGIPVRFGLANESQKMNENNKSSDLIGIHPVIITPDMVGCTIGQFVARECKRQGWVYGNTPREQAQLRFITLVRKLGGDSGFTSGENYV